MDRKTQVPAYCLSLAVATMVGCSSPLVEVSGRVEYEDGSPIEGPVRRIQFVPTADSSAAVRQGASSEIDDDGHFNLETVKFGPGVYRGEYKVLFSVLKSTRTGESLVRPEYYSRKQTPFTVEVTGGKDDYLFQLKKM